MRRPTINIVLWFIFLTVFPSLLFAQEDKSITVKFLPQAVINQSVEDAQEFNYIGGQEVVIPFWVYSSNERSRYLYAEAKQIGYSMQTPYDMTAKITANGSAGLPPLL